MRHAILFSFLLINAGCGALKDALEDNLGTCGTACARVQDCGATPPEPDYGIGMSESSGVGGLDCAAGCASEERAMTGYADCQLDCLEAVECGDMQACWDAGSDVFAEHCGGGGPKIGPEGDGTYDNGTTTGSPMVDEAVENPAVQAAVEASGFVLNFGDSPPAMDSGVFALNWEIVAEQNSRDVGVGSDGYPTDICLWESDEGPDVDWRYCQIGGLTVGLSLIGNNDLFTLVIVDELYQGYITGRVENDGDKTKLVDIDVLVILLWGPDMWERQVWDAILEADIGECGAMVSEACPV